jgi:ribonuclease-3
MTLSFDDRIAQCSARIGYQFTDSQLLWQALVHRSWQAEHNEPLSNERLEFLGDAVLGWVVADLAFHRLDTMAEGKLTDLRRSVVNMHALADLARGLGLGEFILLGRGEEAANGFEKTSILADTFEAIIGAIYLDGGASAAFDFVKRMLTAPIEVAIPQLHMFDAKTRLQELCSRIGVGAPEYDIDGVGPDHERIFTATVVIDGESYGHGEGRTKKAAEQIAAVGAYEVLSAQHDE